MSRAKKRAPKPAPKRAAKPAPKRAAKPAPKRAAKPAPKRAAKPAPKRAAKPAPKRAAKPAPKRAAKPAPKPAPVRAWIRENPPHWDAAKAAIVGGAPAGSLDVGRCKPGDVIPGEWWRVEQDGRVLGYGWMDTTWGEAEILLAVAPQAQRRGVGSFIMERLEHEASLAGLNYMHNVVQPTHPDRDGITRWLEKRGFTDSGEGRWRRRVKATLA